MKIRFRMMSLFAAAVAFASVLASAAPSVAAESTGVIAPKISPAVDRHHARDRAVAYRPVRPYGSWCGDLGWFDFWCGQQFVLMTGIAY